MATTQIISSLRLIGKCDSMQQLYKMIGRICNADCAVLLVGEKGSGRSMVARALHFFSHRAALPFHWIRGNEVREFPDEELLGIDESHAVDTTCYITEFTSMPSFVQHQLVSIHKSKRYRCSHVNRTQKHNLRFILASSAEIKEELENGRMPLDLFYDFNFLPLYVPPLRERKEDIPLLADQFLGAFAAEMKLSHKELSPEATERLLTHEWPGNLDELKEVLRTALSNCRGNYIRAEHLPDLSKQPIGDTEAFTRLKEFLDSKLSSYIKSSPDSLNGNLYRLLIPQIEKSLFQYALKKSKGNKNKAAQLLGLHRNTLNKKLQTL